MHVGRRAERTQESPEDGGPLMASCAHGHSCGQHGFRSPRGAPGKSGLHASGEGERVTAPEPW